MFPSGNILYTVTENACLYSLSHFEPLYVLSIYKIKTQWDLTLYLLNNSNADLHG